MSDGRKTPRINQKAFDALYPGVPNIVRPALPRSWAPIAPQTERIHLAEALRGPGTWLPTESRSTYIARVGYQVVREHIG